MKKKYVIPMIAGLFTGIILHGAVYPTGPITRIQGTVTEISPEHLVFEAGKRQDKYEVHQSEYDFSALALETGNQIMVKARGNIYETSPAKFEKVADIQKEAKSVE